MGTSGVTVRLHEDYHMVTMRRPYLGGPGHLSKSHRSQSLSGVVWDP
jgi:hypothetical protein